MVASPEIRSPQAGALVTVRQAAHEERVAQFTSLVAYNVPAENLAATQGSIATTFRQASPVAATQGSIATTFRQASPVAATQAQVLVAARGRLANARLRAWTFSLDAHDFYVLRLGDTLTLVYDLYSEQWVDWADLGKIFWRANIGTNWIGATGLADQFGSNIVVGDDTYGLLWFLDPDQPYDEHPDYLDPQQQVYFDRVLMGQVTMKGREVFPCYAAWITSDMGQPAYDGAGVTLYTSDDGGVTFDDHGLVTVTLGENSPELSWYSLGQIEAPGRLFKIVDDGAIARIDGLEMNDPDDDR